MTDVPLDDGDIHQLLELLLARLKPSQLRPLMVQIGKHLQQKNKQRITRQQNVDGSRYQPRKRLHTPTNFKTLTFTYQQRSHKVFVVRQTERALLGYYARPDTGNNFAWFRKDKMSQVKAGNERANKKMLLGFRRYLKLRRQFTRQTARVQLGYWDAGPAAPVHHYGHSEAGIQYPARQLLGLSTEDKAWVIDQLDDYLVEALENIT